MEIRKLQAQTLQDALTSMSVGEMCEAPETTTVGSLKCACHYLKAKGYVFTVNTRTGRVYVVRIK